ncbi:DUF3509 domain-containing protein [Pseudomonas turukhanskensis]|uniref:DUF3509 domain-containing protein n=1 Tax=Pseudomonas turukhanskensis TaxID=1806536 RepID=A0A9W6K2P2_9PSED|nr:DUF3509 domain-containing protein [Pseudomonas turukhanskensis]GLK88440.1 hypothetical protein GCM10017655_15020 [Pseudomonas turukhanskensis]
MKYPVKHLFNAFPTYEITFSPRPDTSVLLTLKNARETFSKVIEPAMIFNEKMVGRLIRELRRDMKIANGSLSLNTEQGAFLANRANQAAQAQRQAQAPKQWLSA